MRDFEQLRGVFNESSVCAFSDALGVGYMDWEHICARLADLIEPEERTCHNTAGKPFAGYRMFSCSECGAYLEVDGDTDANLFAGGERPMPRYCPNCGAKVVEE